MRRGGGGIRSSPKDTCPSPFHPHVRTVPVCNEGDTFEAEMKSYGLAAPAPLAITHPSPSARVVMGALTPTLVPAEKLASRRTLQAAGGHGRGPLGA